ncbi:Protein CBG00469 [Caenorhabditis briggsae]|uniref:Protein CBG00469 n=1 Tax=Caenorhabditis briggsae TaxID=6238 RepID=A8WMQ7_CAEBR|nr:Protein CBG00469 [Caenorhabditis briggsae]CAP21762.2 Protein CBG00469 [Caenorhabditis briggsae]
MFIFPSSSSFSLQNSLLYLTANLSSHVDPKVFHWSRIQRTFLRIYIKGARNNPTCSKSFTLSQNSTDLDLKINQDQLIKCGFRAWPKPNSKLMLLSGQVIVAFHPTLVTPSDRAFRAHCEFEDFKQETEIGLEDLIQTHEMILGNFELPEITMRVLSAGEESLRKNKTNQEMRVLKVGDPIIFEWKLEEEHGIFGIQIERCSAETEEIGKGMKILENGCSLDEELISDTTSSSDFSKIYANSLAFKFPEEHVVYIRCAVRTCVKSFLITYSQIIPQVSY